MSLSRKRAPSQPLLSYSPVLLSTSTPAFLFSSARYVGIVRATLELCSTQGADGRAGGLVHSSAEALKAAIVGYEPLGLETPGD